MRGATAFMHKPGTAMATHINKRLYTATLSTRNKHLHARSHHRFVITHFLQLSRGGQQ